MLGALLVPVGVVAVVGTLSLRGEAKTREHLLNEAYRQIAEIVAARVNDRIATLEAELADELAPIAAHSREALIESLRAAQESRPWLRPAVLVRSDGTAIYPVGAASVDVTVWPPEAEDAELREGDLRKAAELYGRAAETAPSAASRTRALNGLARCQYKAGNYRDAISTYESLIGTASSFSPEQATLSLIAHRQRAAAAADLGDAAGARRATLDLYEALVANAAVIDRNFATLYRSHVDRWLSEAPLDDKEAERLAHLRRAEEASLQEEIRRAALLDALRATALPSGGPAGASFAIEVSASLLPSDAHSAEPAAATERRHSSSGMPPIVVTNIGAGGSGRILLAHEWRAEQVRGLLAEVLDDPGPWDETSVGLMAEPAADGVSPILASVEIPEGAALTASAVELLPSWRVVAFPSDGSVSDLVARGVRHYALMLGLALVAVVVAVALGARSVSRELSLVRLRAQFVSSVSHELRTPLSLIRMFTESLEEDWIDDSMRAATYSKIRRETERLTGLIDNVLDFSRLESGTRAFDFTDFDLNDLVIEAVQRLGPEFDAAEVDCRVELSAPVRLRADREAIDRVLVNLLSNAVKYIGEGERQIVVAAWRNGDRAGLRVADTGIGIAPDDADRIFERYFRADACNARSVVGSGIGLTVCKGIVDAHGGAIEVRSGPGGGSEFTVWLPTNPESEP